MARLSGKASHESGCLYFTIFGDITPDVGDVILFSSLLLHKTGENTTPKSRWAYVAEMLKLGDFDPTIKAPYFIAATMATRGVTSVSPPRCGTAC